MQRMKDADLNKLSVDFAGDYVQRKFKKGRDVEKSRVLNCIAHGFYMGARHIEKYSALTPWGQLGQMVQNIFTRDYIPLHPDTDMPWIEKHADKAALYYLKKKKFLKLPMGDKALIQATVSLGFQEGVKVRSIHAVTEGV